MEAAAVEMHAAGVFAWRCQVGQLKRSANSAV